MDFRQFKMLDCSLGDSPQERLRHRTLARTIQQQPAQVSGGSLNSLLLFAYGQRGHLSSESIRRRPLIVALAY